MTIFHLRRLFFNNNGMLDIVNFKVLDCFQLLFFLRQEYDRLLMCILYRPRCCISLQIRYIIKAILLLIDINDFQLCEAKWWGNWGNYSSLFFSLLLHRRYSLALNMYICLCASCNFVSLNIREIWVRMNNVVLYSTSNEYCWRDDIGIRKDRR